MKPVRAVIADDEEHARRRIRTLLDRRDDLEVVAECGTARSTVEAVREHRPELLFLDVQMPRGGGFGVLRALTDEGLPAVIFVTAYQQYAIDAFEARAVDYLLKPFDDERFEEALRHALTRLDEAEARRLRERLLDLIDDGESGDAGSRGRSPIVNDGPVRARPASPLVVGGPERARRPLQVPGRRRPGQRIASPRGRRMLDASPSGSATGSCWSTSTRSTGSPRRATT